ncbi:MAG TPA: DNA phosphorothioation-associated putative methyltransferase [Microvirga sp.]
MEGEATIPRHKTALSRTDLSRPLRGLLTDGLLAPGRTIMDYGCGRGGDTRRLRALGYDCVGWDPVHAPDGPRRPSDVVNLGYVVNVIERPVERVEALRAAWGLARQLLVVSARLVDEQAPGGSVVTYADGLVTRIGTFQKFYEHAELKTWIDQALEVQSVAAAPGVFYAFRDPAERSSFLASRFRRVAAQPRLHAHEAAYASHRPLLDALAAFVAERGRLPERDELREYSDLEAALGSVSRAYRVLERVSGDQSWNAVREARSQDLLVFLGLSRFEGKHSLGALATAMQHDIKAFFGSFAEATRRANDLLFSLGRADERDAACRASPVGKAMPEALYVHLSALGELPPLLRLYEGCARTLTGTVPGANIVKLGLSAPKISYLSYPAFESDPHPSLASSTSIDLQTFRIRERSYVDRKNPPLLHRKEQFVSASHPSREKYARLTRLEEQKGLYENPASIGTREGWTAALRGKRLALRGHRLVAATGPEA